MITKTFKPDSIRDQVSLGLLLSFIGYQPVQIIGDEHLYKNVFRNYEQSPTLAINTKLDLWFDRYTKKSGDVVDFAMTYWSDLNSAQILDKIRQICLKNSVAGECKRGRKRRAIKIPYYHVQETMPLGSNTEITSYLKSQGVWEMVVGELKEVYYYVVDEKHRRKDFFAAGWQNENGGWEVRCKNFAGCIGRKGMSFISGKANHLILFDDCIDYLSWKYEHRTSPASVLILNSSDFFDAAKRRAAKFQNADFSALKRSHPKSYDVVRIT